MSKPILYIAELDDFSQDVLFHLRERFEILAFDTSKDIKEILQEVDVFWFRLGYKMDHNVIDTKTRCKYLVTPVTGIDHIDSEVCAMHGISIISLKGETTFLKNIRATAEHTIGLTLALLRKLNPAIEHVKHGGWNRDLFRGEEIFEKKVGIIGFGRLGQITASYFKALGANVGYYDIADVDHQEFYKYSSIEELCMDADIISVHVNYDSTTYHLINDSLVSKMSKKPYIINTSRGGIINEKTILNALMNHTIKGAALDVLEGEPNVFNNALIEYSKHHDNLIITPHIGGNTFESFQKTELFIAEKLIRTYDQ